MLLHKKPTVCQACGGAVSWTWRDGQLGYAHLLPSDHGAILTPYSDNIGTDMGPMFLTPKFSGNVNYGVRSDIVSNPMGPPVVNPAGIGWTIPGIAGYEGPTPMSTSKPKSDTGK